MTTDVSKEAVEPGGLKMNACPHCHLKGDEPKLEIVSRLPRSSPKNFPPLLFVHGGWHSAFCWEPHFMPFFADRGYECHAVSLRGHGASEGKDKMNSHRIADYTRDICRAATSLRSPPVIVAHSFGGFSTAHYLAHHRPAAVALLTPIPPTGLLAILRRWIVMKPLLVLTANLTLNPRLLVESPEVAKSFFFSESLPDELNLKYHAKLDSESYMAFLDGLFLDLPQRPKVDCPTMVLGAEFDRLVSQQDNRITTEFFGARFVQLSNIAHNVMLEENWQKAAEALQDFLSEVERP